MIPADHPVSSSSTEILSPDNVLFALARTGHLRLPQSWLERHSVLIDRILYPLSVLLFAFITPVVSVILGLPLILMGRSVGQNQPDLEIMLILIGSFLPIFLLIWLWLQAAEQRPLWTTGMTRPAFKPYLRGLVIGFLLLSAAVLLLAIASFLDVENPGNTQSKWAVVTGTILVLFGWMVQGAAEELLARGFLLPILGIRWGALPAIIVSSLFFSSLHLANPNLSLISLANLSLFGLFAALYALSEGSLWGIFAIHAIWNWAQSNLFGFSVSGLDTQSSVLYDLAETGPDWITGGSFGPEGGIIVTLVLLSGIMLLVFWSRRKKPASGY